MSKKFDAPLTDTWWGCRSWIGFYGAFPRGFLAKARELVLNGQPFDSPILHVCSGRVRDYATRGFGSNDKRLDLDPDLNPEILGDARDPSLYNGRVGPRFSLILHTLLRTQTIIGQNATCSPPLTLLDAALEWAARNPAASCASVEVHPLLGWSGQPDAGAQR